MATRMQKKKAEKEEQVCVPARPSMAPQCDAAKEHGLNNVREIVSNVVNKN